MTSGVWTRTLTLLAGAALCTIAVGVAAPHAQAACGDGIVDTGEACDDGNTDAGDGCGAGCAVEPGYDCPPTGGACTDFDECAGQGDGNDCDANATCTNTPGGYTCECNGGFAGDGTTCDCSPGLYGATCSNTCPGGLSNVCGGHGTCDDGIAGRGECTCDGGWYVDDGGGSLVTTGAGICDTTICGDGVAVAAADETCDDGNFDLHDSCPSGPGGTCVPATCGDGFIRRDTEACDDGDANSDVTPNTCRTDCALPGCADGVTDDGSYTYRPASAVPDTVTTPSAVSDPVTVELNEGCDDGNLDNHDGCPDGVGGTCQLAICGDGFVRLDAAGLEACDDGLVAAAGDGCDLSCNLEPGWTCDRLVGTTCTQACGSFFDFTSSDFGFTAATWAGSGWAYGTTSQGTAGWETGLGTDLALSEQRAVLWRSVAVPPAADVKRPMLIVDAEVDLGTAAENCLEVYVEDALPLALSDPAVSVCGEQGASLLEVDLSGAAGENKIIAIAVDANITTPEHFGATLRSVELFGDADGDDVADYKSMSCGDGCVDEDGDRFGDVTSKDLTTCDGGSDLDCDDGRYAIHPSAPEQCDSGFDDNCNGDTDAEDPSCYEDCGDGIDNGTPPNGLIDCADPYCAGTITNGPTVDAFCAQPCLRHWTFDSGPSFAAEDLDAGTPDVQSIWEFSQGQWATGHLADSGTRQFGRLHFTAAMGGIANTGPEPVLQVTFEHDGTTPDVFAACFDNPDCEGNEVDLLDSVVLLAAAPTDGIVTATIPLIEYADQADVQITLLFDTLPESSVYTAAGVTIYDVKIFSNVDHDTSYEGGNGDKACDQCWDKDGDSFGDANSPDLLTCPAYGPDMANPIADCDDNHSSVTPANSTETNCRDHLDNDCDGLIDALDDQCGSEDCANGVDDNGDGNIDCDDPTCVEAFACDPCFEGLGFDFAKGVASSGEDTGASGGWTSTGRLGATTEKAVFQWGNFAAPRDGELGWETRLNADVSSAGNGRVRGWLTRTVTVPTTLPQPELELLYRLEGDGTDDTFGVCFNVLPTACSASAPGHIAWSTTTNTAGDGFERAYVEIPKNAVDIVIFFDTTNANDNDHAGAFVAEALVRSDIDRDRLGCASGDPSCGPENFGRDCDVCVDKDGDGRGDSSYSVTDVSLCPVPDVIDCDDDNGDAYPRASEEDFCYMDAAGQDIDADNDCDGYVDGLDADCITCGNGYVEGDETCDDGNTDAGDGCDADCQVEAGRLYVTELHLPVLFGSPAEQWIELYNTSGLNLDLATLELELHNSAGDSATFGPVGTGCYANTRLDIPNRTYYIIAFGDPTSADFADSSQIDAFCPDFTLNPSGDALTITKKGATDADREVDTVDFGGFGCATGFAKFQADDGLNRGRSLLLASAQNSNKDLNDDASAWCLAGPTDVYSGTGRHLGGPKVPGGGGCAEFACDGEDDDCDGATDEVSELANDDNDTICNERDCDKDSALCDFAIDDARCSADFDGDGIIDCRDTCEDADKDGYGVDGQAATAGNGCQGLEPLRCDQSPLEFPDNVELASGSTDTAKCINGLDDNCDGAADCLDAACQPDAICAAEVCERAEPISCGDTVLVTPRSVDFMACLSGVSAAGADKVYAFTADTTGTIELRIDNLGTRLFMLQVAEAACAHDSCDPFLLPSSTVPRAAESNCITGGRLDVSVTAGTTYYVVAKHIGTCSEGNGVSGNLTLSCDEVCDPSGVDEDADGFTDCADDECVLAADCLSYDYDNDGVTNADETTCHTSPLQPNESPDDDGFLDPDGDLVLNCVDDDDDDDGAPDALEIDACADPLSKNNPYHYPAASCDAGDTRPACGGAAPPVCDQAGVDGDCNGELDTTQAICGVKEDDCGDNIDNDSDGKIDCGIGLTVPPDEDCVYDSLCATFDFDGDSFDNEAEIYCNTDPLCASNDQEGCGDVVALQPSPPESADDTDGDGLPNCYDADDDGDGFPDNEEIVCGSNPNDHADHPQNTDGDSQCDAVDPDDDGDGFLDVVEQSCLSDSKDATSTPRDATHDIDQDGTCNQLDADDDGDGWLDLDEATCETDPNDGADNPTDNGEDLDDDRLCDKLDADDDDDTWSDIDEQACGYDPHNPLDFPTDTDGDTVCDAIDPDDDGDGVDDATELLCLTDPLDEDDRPLQADTLDPDHDGLANCVDDDDDDDNVSDVNEELIGSDPQAVDTDQDGLDDGVENANHDGVVDANETSPLKKDSDGDGLTDLQEADSCYPLPDGGCAPTLGWVQDTDGDGLFDSFEDLDKDGDTGTDETNPLVADSDGDGFNDGQERGCLSDPLDPDSVPVDLDGSGVCDGAEADTDLDGVSDGVEVYCGNDPFDGGDTPLLSELVDTDGDLDLNCRDLDDDDDEASDEDELVCGTDPLSDADTPSIDDVADYDLDGELNCVDDDDDDDGLRDAAEQTAGTSRLDRDSDDDGISDGLEVNVHGTDPTKRDTDEDGVSDGVELGLEAGTVDTDEALFQADLDPETTTLAKTADSDGDGLTDGEEDLNGNGRVDAGETNPNDPTDGLHDTDGDGLTDRAELLVHNTDPLDPDTDDDELDDKLEVSVWRTDPNNPDSDAGGIIDGYEVQNGTDPADEGDDFDTSAITGDNVFSCSGGPARDTLIVVFGLLAFAWWWRRRRSLV